MHHRHHPSFITHADQLHDLIESLQTADTIGLDTEFVRERTYYPAFCLLQIASRDKIDCVDPLAFETLEPLEAILSNPKITKIFHSARQDLEVLLHHFGVLPLSIADTQLAAAFVGHADQIGYAKLVLHICNISLPKDATRTDWSRRPLSSEQIRYAAEDVAFLREAHEHLTEQLELRGRLAWYREECQNLLKPGLYDVRPEEAWKRLSGTQPLTDPAKQRLQSLAFWRESSAHKFNLPRAWIVKDDLLLQIAFDNVRDPQLFTPIRGLKAWSQQELSESFREMFSKLPPLDQAFDANLAIQLQRDPERKRLMQDLSAIVRQIATDLGLPASLLASRRDLDALLDNPEECRVLRGWRLPIIGQRLEAATHGFSPGYP
jgi:ribonuclease D